MPTTVGSLILFVAFLGPGLAFLLTRERRRPQPERSPFREVASLVLSGLICNIIAALLFGVGRWLWPRLTPDIGQLIRTPVPYARSHYAELWFAGLTFLGVALSCAVILGYQDFLKWRFLGFLRGEIVVDPAWELVFNSAPVQGFAKYCGCTLEDGTWIVGRLASSSPDVKESGDRDLVLAPPIKFRTEEGKLEASNAERAVISARRVVLLEVHYYPTETDDPFADGNAESASAG